MKRRKTSGKRRTVEILPETYKPTKAELEEDLGIDASPQKIARALMQPVKVVEKSVEKHRAQIAAKRTTRPGK